MRQLVRCITLILLCAKLLYAQDDFTTFSPSALATGLGGSLVGFPEHPTMIYWNPGALAFTTTEQIFFSSHQPSTINNVCYTRFFAPYQTFGVSLSRLIVHEQLTQVFSVAYSRRHRNYLSLGINLNYGHDGYTSTGFTTFSVGAMLRPTINQRSFYRTGPQLDYLFLSPSLYEKFALGFVIHNIPIGATSSRHSVRMGTSFKFSNWGPSFHLAYHILPHQRTFHTGMGFRFSRQFQFLVGTRDFNFKDLAFGGSFTIQRVMMDVIYSSRTQRFALSIALRLSDPTDTIARRHLSRGIQLVRELRYRKALEQFRKSLSYNQNNEKIIFLTRALEQKILKENRKVDSLYTQAVNFKQKGWNVSAVLLLKRILQIDRDNKRALHLLRSLMPFVHKHIETKLNEGTVAFRQHRYDTAKKIFQDILLINDHHADAIRYLGKIDSVNSYLSNDYYYRGIGYYQRKHFKKAQQALRRVLELNPDHQEARIYLQRIQQEFARQRPIIEKLYREAHSLERNGNYQLASQKYRKILTLNRDDKKAAKQLELLSSYINDLVHRKFWQAQNLFNDEKYEQAARIFREITEMNPDHQPSLEYLSRIRSIQSEVVNDYLDQARQRFNENQLDEALLLCNKGLDMDPGHPGLLQLKEKISNALEVQNLQQRGIQALRNGNPVEARQYFRQILTYDPNHVFAKTYIQECDEKINTIITQLFKSGMTFYTSGNYEAAIRDWDRILAIEPNHKSTLEYKRRAEERLEALRRLP